MKAFSMIAYKLNTKMCVYTNRHKFALAWIKNEDILCTYSEPLRLQFMNVQREEEKESGLEENNWEFLVSSTVGL